MEYKEIAKIWFDKGLKEFQTALENSKIPNWNDYFDRLWKEFTEMKLKCKECGFTQIFKLDLDETFDIKESFNKFIFLFCKSSGKAVDIDNWEIIK